MDVPPRLGERITALIEVVLCSDYPTQLALAATFGAFGFTDKMADGSLSLSYVVVLSLADTFFLLALILLFLRAHGERPRDVFLGARFIAEEARYGVGLIFAALAIGVAVLVAIQALVPWLHTVARNPLQDLVSTRESAAIFAVVVVVAGGVREELQRAFVLRRFEQHLGGGGVGIVVGSVAFGAGHLLQGADAAIATALLGAFWGIVYLRRRSSVAPIVSHSGFNLMQLAQFLLISH
jgi:membrane protease YdiL (CAAX protease family)